MKYEFKGVILGCSQVLPSTECLPLSTVEAVAHSDTALSHRSALSLSVQESYGSLSDFFL